MRASPIGELLVFILFLLLLFFQIALFLFDLLIDELRLASQDDREDDLLFLRLNHSNRTLTC